MIRLIWPCFAVGLDIWGQESRKYWPNAKTHSQQSNMTATLDNITPIIEGFLYYETPAIDATTSIYKDLGFDSLDIAELSLAIEDTYNVIIDLSDNISTVNDIINAINDQLNIKLTS